MKLPTTREELFKTLEQAKDWSLKHVLTLDNLYQLTAVVGILLVAHISARICRRMLGQIKSHISDSGIAHKIISVLDLNIGNIFVFLYAWIASHALAAADFNAPAISIITSLALAWVVINLISSFTTRTPVTRFFVFCIWIIAALSIMGLLTPLVDSLNNMVFQLGNIKISIYSALKAITLFILLLWAATAISKVVERQINHSPVLTPSLQVLISKFIKITLITLVTLITLSTIGIDLSALAVLSGAIGVGLGFGLQKIVSNLISGFILLLDKSVKPGDVIQIGDTFGWITSLGARYTSVATRDGMEHLIPNETFVTEPVINWSFSNELVRLVLPIGIHYNSDVKKALKICEKAAQGIERVVRVPAPACHISGFGDSAVDLKLCCWIKDPKEGTLNVKGKIYLEIWEQFKKHNIEIPYPQRDIYIKEAPNQTTTKAKAPAQPKKAPKKASTTKAKTTKKK